MDIKNKNMMIVLANSAAAKVFSYDTKSKQLTLLMEPMHLKSTLKTSEIMADEAGRYQKSAAPNQGAYEPQTDPKAVEAKKFADKLAEDLLDLEKKADNFIIIAPGHFQHYIKNKLNSTELNKKTQFFDKDYTKLPIKELEKHLTELLNIKF